MGTRACENRFKVLGRPILLSLTRKNFDSLRVNEVSLERREIFQNGIIILENVYMLEKSIGSTPVQTILRSSPPLVLSTLNLARRPLPVVRLDFYRYVKINENNSRGIESFFSRSNQFCYFILIISVYIYIYIYVVTINGCLPAVLFKRGVARFRYRTYAYSLAPVSVSLSLFRSFARGCTRRIFLRILFLFLLLYL